MQARRDCLRVTPQNVQTRSIGPRSNIPSPPASLRCALVNKTRLLVAVVDDEEAVRIALRRLLRSASLSVETFSSGAEFLESIKEHQPDCVILDLHMPQVGGFGVQARLAEAGIRLPTVVITGHDTDESRERALAGGAAAYLRKPVDDQALLDAITEAVRTAHS
jgi:FixJ family two-component response regulator